MKCCTHPSAEADLSPFLLKQIDEKDHKKEKKYRKRRVIEKRDVNKIQCKQKGHPFAI